MHVRGGDGGSGGGGEFLPVRLFGKREKRGSPSVIIIMGYIIIVSLAVVQLPTALETNLTTLEGGFTFVRFPKKCCFCCCFCSHFVSKTPQMDDGQQFQAEDG